MSQFELPKQCNEIKELEDEIGGDIFKAAYYALDRALTSWFLNMPALPDYNSFKSTIDSMLTLQSNYMLYSICASLRERLEDRISGGDTEIMRLVDLIVEKEGKEKYGPRKLLRGL